MTANEQAERRYLDEVFTARALLTTMASQVNLVNVILRRPALTDERSSYALFHGGETLDCPSSFITSDFLNLQMRPKR